MEDPFTYPSPPIHYDMLEQVFERQLLLQRNAYGKDPQDLAGEERIQYIKDMVLAATDELHEALGEVGWKPWATSRHINEPALRGELVDLFHFFINLCLVAGMTPHQLFCLYIAKARRNEARQKEGYDGVAGKCPGCRRAFDDPAVSCIPGRCAKRMAP